MWYLFAIIAFCDLRLKMTNVVLFSLLNVEICNYLSTGLPEEMLFFTNGEYMTIELMQQ